MRFQPRLGDALAGWIPGDYRYRITAEGNQTWEETLALDFDDAGRFILKSRRHRGQLTMFINESVFYVTDFVGKGNSLLAVLATGLARVPFLAETNVVWHDTVSAVPFMQAPLRWAHDTLDPFLGPAVLPYEYLHMHELTGSGIQCKLTDGGHLPTGAARQAPTEIMTRLHERSGVASVNVRFGNDRLWSAECVHHEPRLHSRGFD